MMTGPIIECAGLTRDFRRRGKPMLRALDAVSFTVEPGAAVGYIGANGAGKSTTIKLLTGILVASSGTVRTCGLDPVRERIALTYGYGIQLFHAVAGSS